MMIGFRNNNTYMTVDKLAERKAQKSIVSDATIDDGDIVVEQDSEWVNVCSINSIISSNNDVDTNYSNFDLVREAVQSVTDKNGRFRVVSRDGEFVVPFDDPIRDIRTDKFSVESLSLTSDLEYSLSENSVYVVLNKRREVLDDVPEDYGLLPETVADSLRNTRDELGWIVEYDNKEEAFVVPLDDPFETVVLREVYGDDVSEEDRERMEEESGYHLADLLSKELRVNKLDDNDISIVREDNSIIGKIKQFVNNYNNVTEHDFYKALYRGYLFDDFGTTITGITKFGLIPVCITSSIYVLDYITYVDINPLEIYTVPNLIAFVLSFLSALSFFIFIFVIFASKFFRRCLLAYRRMSEYESDF